MKQIKYFIQFLIIIILFLIFKILGLKISSMLSSKIVSYIGPFFRSKKLIRSNILKALPNLNEQEIKNMDEYTYQWNADNYGNEDEPILKITKSSLGSHVWCPKKYEFGYIQRLPQDQSEAMRKGTLMHNAREDFFNTFDIKKAEDMSHDELVDYCTSLFPLDDYFDDYLSIASFEANRFSEAVSEGKTDEYLPVCNEGKFDCEITIAADTDPKFPLRRDYKVHL